MVSGEAGPLQTTSKEGKYVLMIPDLRFRASGSGNIDCQVAIYNIALSCRCGTWCSRVYRVQGHIEDPKTLNAIPYRTIS